MPNTKNNQNSGNAFQNETKLKIDQQTHGDVWQDKIGTSSDRVRLHQPAPVGSGVRSPQTNRSIFRSQKAHVQKKSLVPLNLWVSPIVKAEIQRQAQLQNLSASATGSALLEEILRQKLHVQQAATLETVIDKLFEKSQRKLANRLAALLIRIAFDSGQTRVLATNILGRQPGMTEKNIKEVLSMGDKRTKANLTRRTPQLKELEDVIEKYLLAEDETDRKNEKEKEAGK
jgi:hypothetical protein